MTDEIPDEIRNVLEVQPLHSTDELEDMPTLEQGYTDDLKIKEDSPDGSPWYKVWLGRAGRADGEPFDNPVTIELYDGHRWYNAVRYCGDRPSDILYGTPEEPVL